MQVPLTGGETELGAVCGLCQAGKGKRRTQPGCFPPSARELMGGMLPGMALGWSHPEDGNSWAHQTHDGLRVKLNDLAH